MYMAALAVPPSFRVALVAGVIVLGGGLAFAICHTRAIRAALRQRELELDDLRAALGERCEQLREAEREIERLHRVPRAEILPMLQLAHELRSPLAAVQSALDVLLQGYAATSLELQNEMLELARERTEAMLTRVNDFMRLRTVQDLGTARQAEAVQLVEVVRRLAPEMRVRARWRAITLHVDVPQGLSPVRARYADMEHLVSNLVSNAIKYTHPGGQVTVSLQADGDVVRGTVADTGIGIPPEDLPRIFDEFYRAEEAIGMDATGSGLGLAIVKRIVDLYGGDLQVESQPGEGSRFTFIFPAIGTERG